MRPHDENQHGSMRPNLMSASARRASSEENILAMLERDSAERGSSTRMAWYGAGSALALVLVGALGWLAWDNGVLHDEELLTPMAVAAPAPAPIVASAAAPRAPAIQPARAAAIVEAAPEPVRLAQAGPSMAPEPLVLLSPDEVASRQRAADRHAAEPAARKAEPKHRTVQARSARKSLAAKAAARQKAHPRPKAQPRKKVQARPARRAVELAASKSGKAKAPDARVKTAAPSPTPSADASPDRDVALISAILAQPPGRAAEHPSGPRLAPQPLD